jgi:heme/copper-type cytochrome/quinol oxidase subunit 3
MVAEGQVLPVGAVGRSGPGWWGIVCVILSEGALFVYLLFSYFYYAIQISDDWVPGTPSFTFSLPGIVVLLVSGAAIWWGERGAIVGDRPQTLIGFLIAALLGSVFVALQCLDWSSKSFTARSGEWGSIFYTATGLHLIHLIVGLVALLLILAWSALGYFDARRHTPVLIVAAYWYFVVAVGLAIFIAFNLLPYIW